MPEQDHDDAHDDRERSLMLTKAYADRAEKQTSRDENHREPQHEQARSDQHATTACRLEILHANAGHVGEVTGKQRKHARREERDESGYHGDRDSKQK